MKAPIPTKTRPPSNSARLPTVWLQRLWPTGQQQTFEHQLAREDASRVGVSLQLIRCWPCMWPTTLCRDDRCVADTVSSDADRDG